MDLAVFSPPLSDSLRHKQKEHSRGMFFPAEMKDIAEITLNTWDPSWLFVATPSGFLFTPCRFVADNKGQMWQLSENWAEKRIQDKYLELLKDFEFPRASVATTT
ncbi:MAG: hypothetical protein UY99_C0008G0011 [Parcubacteria group bacterium GW2011_GWA1_59_11]|nr:MAG: hypothetical protein UY99_C0008G0011 [Parcubacteria group bacterium GW2011_GWA1_59_11]